MEDKRNGLSSVGAGAAAAAAFSLGLVARESGRFLVVVLSMRLIWRYFEGLQGGEGQNALLYM